MKRRNDTFAVAVLLLGLLLAFARVAVGCGPSAEAAYGAALLRCVDQSATLAESRECRRIVDGNYGITQTTRKDAGQ